MSRVAASTGSSYIAVVGKHADGFGIRRFRAAALWTVNRVVQCDVADTVGEVANSCADGDILCTARHNRAVGDTTDGRTDVGVAAVLCFFAAFQAEKSERLAEEQELA